MNKRIREKLAKKQPHQASSWCARVIEPELPAYQPSAEERDVAVFLGTATSLVGSGSALNGRDFIHLVGNPDDHVVKPQPHVTTLYWKSDDDAFQADASIIHMFDAKGRQKNYLQSIRLYPGISGEVGSSELSRLKNMLKNSGIAFRVEKKLPDTLNIHYQHIHALMEDRSLLPPLMRCSMREAFEEYEVYNQFGERYR